MSTAVATPKAQATAQATAQAQANSGKSTSNGNTGGNKQYRTDYGQTTTTQNGGKIYHDKNGYTAPGSPTDTNIIIDGQAMQDIADSGSEWIGFEGSGFGNDVFYSY